MVDYSKIDWTKCKLKPLSRLMANGEIRQFTITAHWDSAHYNAVIAYERVYHVMARTGHGSLGWQFLSCNIVSTTDDMLELIERAKEVNTFIAAETARIEAEEAAKSHVTVPWQDVEWLRGIGVKVQRLLYGTKDWVAAPTLEPVYPAEPYRAHRDALPPGYDPEKPRWVDIERSDVVRLERSGCAIQRRASDAHDDWMARGFPGDPPSGKCDYRVDMHTVQPGVPLHEEPKPVPRLCEMEFALTNPAFSEFRARGCHREYWSKWLPINSDWEGRNLSHFYEFRTTAPAEKKSRVVAEITVESLVSGFYGNKCTLNALTSPISNGVRNAVTLEVEPGCFDSLKGKKPRLAIIVDEES